MIDALYALGRYKDVAAALQAAVESDAGFKALPEYKAGDSSFTCVRCYTVLAADYHAVQGIDLHGCTLYRALYDTVWGVQTDTYRPKASHRAPSTGLLVKAVNAVTVIDVVAVRSCADNICCFGLASARVPLFHSGYAD